MKLEPESPLATAFGRAAPLPDIPLTDLGAYLRCDLGAVLINSACGSDAIGAALGRAAGVRVPQTGGAFAADAQLRAIWLGPHSWLLQCPPAEEEALVGRINAAFADKGVHAVPYSDSVCWFALYGPRALALLAEGGFVSLEPGGIPAGHAKRTLLAGVAVVVLREDTHGWLLGVERSRAGYFAQWLRCAAARAATFERFDDGPRRAVVAGAAISVTAPESMRDESDA